MIKLNPDLPEKTFWDQNDGHIDLAAFIILKRNIDRFLFPSKLDKDKRAQILSLLSKPLIDQKQGLLFLKGEECSPLDKEWLQEHFFLSNPLQDFQKGSGVLINSGPYSTILNVQEHLQLRFLGSKGELEEGWTALSKQDDLLQEGAPFAFSPHFGFLTSLPKDAGTGLEVAILLQTPALSLYREEEHLLFKEEDRIESLPLFSNSSGVERGLLLIRNKASIGMSEDQTLSLVKGFAEKVIGKENSLRKRLLETDESGTKDKVARAFGLLIHSYQIETLEAIEAFGWIKIGLENGWIRGVDRRRLNRLLISVRRGHLNQKLEGEASREELLHKRTELLHSELKGIELLI